MNKRHSHISPHRMIKWYQCDPLILMMAFVSVLGWLALSVSAVRELDLQPTHLTLRGDRCAYLRAKGVRTTPLKLQHLCSVVVPFRDNAITGGGIIMLGDSEIRVADNEIFEVGATVDQPWTHQQTQWVILACISTIVTLGLVTWVLINTITEWMIRKCTY